MMAQRIIFPWSMKTWPDRRDAILTEATSIAAIDNLMTKNNKLRPRQVSEALNNLDENTRARFVKETFPHMQHLIKIAPKKFPKKYYAIIHDDTLQLSREQVVIIIACMWFNLFDYNYIGTNLDNFPDPTLNKIWDRPNMLAVECMVNYFEQVMARKDDEYFAAGIVVILRGNSMDHDWSSDMRRILPVIITPDQTKLRAVPTTEYFGGDMFAGNSAAEIALLITPECLVAALFCAKYEHTNTNNYITIIGAESINKVAGIGSSAKFISNNIDQNYGLNSDETEIIVQNAMLFICTSPQTSAKNQFITSFTSDANKFHAAFGALKLNDKIVTGAHWGCGNIYYNQHVKFIQQLLAASARGLALHYPSAGRDFDEQITQFSEWLVEEKVTCQQLYMRYRKAVKENMNSRLNDLDIFRYIAEM